MKAVKYLSHPITIKSVFSLFAKNRVWLTYLYFHNKIGNGTLSCNIQTLCFLAERGCCVLHLLQISSSMNPPSPINWF